MVLEAIGEIRKSSSLLSLISTEWKKITIYVRFHVVNEDNYMKLKYKICPKCNKEIGPQAFKRHVDKCESIKKNINYFELGFFEIISNDFVRCLKCNKIIKNKKQYANNHYSRAHVLDKKHFTKNAKEKIAKTKIGKKHSIEHKKKISESVRSSYTDEMRRVKSELAIKNEFGGTISGRVIEYDHFGEKVNLQSSYELKVAKSLDENNIKWIRPKYFFWNDCNNKKHRYYPDFYLIDYDVYLDPKSDYLIENINPYFGMSDKEKIKTVELQNNVKIVILTKRNLSWEEIKNLI